MKRHCGKVSYEQVGESSPVPDLFGELQILLFIDCCPMGEESLFTGNNEIKAGETNWLKRLQQGWSSGLEEQEGCTV